MHIKIQSSFKKILSDTITPVGLYLQLRDEFPNALLLESSDYGRKQNSYSYICLKALASFKADTDTIEIKLGDQLVSRQSIQETKLAIALDGFVQQFEVAYESLGFLTQGLFGYTAYDAIPLHHPIIFRHRPVDVPLVHYQYFQFVIVFNHFNNELYLIENLPEGTVSGFPELEQLLEQRNIKPYAFTAIGANGSNFTDEQFLQLIEKGKEYCYMGDVFQVVLSRQFYDSFKGDEFNVYRALRSVNPSPYLFYFDYGGYKLMGSSPEAQIRVAGHKAILNPIAGTFRRTGDPEQDRKLAEILEQDPKENAEHVMLVDLARNDLSINSEAVKVQKYKYVEMYSHVMHLVSAVEAQLKDGYNAAEIFLDTFPAGTLSGAPKHRAMQIIDALENTPRGLYGGAVGIIGLDASFNHAIFIRSILSRNQTLYYQAGCGIVTRSVPESELQEVYNKIDAVRSAIQLAQNIR